MFAIATLHQFQGCPRFRLISNCSASTFTFRSTAHTFSECLRERNIGNRCDRFLMFTAIQLPPARASQASERSMCRARNYGSFLQYPVSPCNSRLKTGSSLLVTSKPTGSIILRAVLPYRVSRGCNPGLGGRTARSWIVTNAGRESVSQLCCTVLRKNKQYRVYSLEVFRLANLELTAVEDIEQRFMLTRRFRRFGHNDQAELRRRKCVRKRGLHESC